MQIRMSLRPVSPVNQFRSYILLISAAEKRRSSRAEFEAPLRRQRAEGATLDVSSMRSADHLLWWNPHLADDNHQASVVASVFPVRWRPSPSRAAESVNL